MPELEIAKPCELAHNTQMRSCAVQSPRLALRSGSARFRAILRPELGQSQAKVRYE
jgi:hypothetical protein